MKRKILAKNKKARFNYTILDTYEAGIALLGSEVKALRNSRGNINEAYIRPKNSEIFVYNMYIGEYEFANQENHNTFRIRKLLLHKKEIKKIVAKIKEGGLTVVPLEVYFNEKGKVKLSIALAKGKKLYDKRQSIKEREEKIKIKRAMK